MKTRKILLMIIMTVVCDGAMAEWFKVSVNETDVFYADPATMIKSAHRVKMQTLHDHKIAMKVSGITFWSTVAQEEYDCRERQSRAIYFSLHSKNFGRGRKVYSDADSHEWAPVRPGSIRETLWNFACKKK